MKYNVKYTALFNIAIIIIIALSIQSCSSSKKSLSNQKCDGKKIIERLESKWNYPAIARENNVEGLLKVELKYDTTFLVRSIQSHLSANGTTLNIYQDTAIVNIFYKNLTKNLNELLGCKIPISKYNLSFLFKIKNSAMDIKKYRYDVLIEVEPVEIIEIDN